MGININERAEVVVNVHCIAKITDVVNCRWMPWLHRLRDEPADIPIAYRLAEKRIPLAGSAGRESPVGKRSKLWIAADLDAELGLHIVGILARRVKIASNPGADAVGNACKPGLHVHKCIRKGRLSIGF